MNAISSTVRRANLWLGLIAALMLITGCATPRIDWSSRIGSYTFDNAVLELGPPENHITLTDGRIVAEWLTSRGGAYVYPDYAYGSYPYWYATPPRTTYINSPDYYLRLTFGPDGRLQAWKKIVK